MRRRYGKTMANEFEKLICKTLEENPGADLKFTRTVETQAYAVDGDEQVPDRVVVAAELKGGGRWLSCRMYEEGAHEAMLESVECLRRQREDERTAAAAPEPDYVPTSDEQAELAARVVFSCKSCANTGVGVRGSRCPCMRRTKVESDG